MPSVASSAPTATSSAPSPSGKKSRARKSKSSRGSTAQPSQTSSAGKRSGADQAKLMQSAMSKFSTQFGLSELLPQTSRFYRETNEDNIRYAFRKIRDTVTSTLGADALPGYMANQDMLTWNTGAGDADFKSYVDGLQTEIEGKTKTINAYNTVGPLKGILTKKVRRALEKDKKLQAVSSMNYSMPPMSDVGSSRATQGRGGTTAKTIDPTTGKATERQAKLAAMAGQKRGASEAGLETSKSKRSRRSKSSDTAASTSGADTKAMSTINPNSKRSTLAKTAASSTSGTGKAFRDTHSKLTGDELKAMLGKSTPQTPSLAIQPTIAPDSSLGDKPLTESQMKSLTPGQIAHIAKSSAPGIERAMRQRLSPKQIAKAESMAPTDAEGTTKLVNSMAQSVTDKVFETLGEELRKRTPRVLIDNGQWAERKEIESVGPDGTRAILTWIERRDGTWTETKQTLIPTGTVDRPSWVGHSTIDQQPSAPNSFAQTVDPLTTQAPKKEGLLRRMLSSAPATSAPLLITDPSAVTGGPRPHPFGLDSIAPTTGYAVTPSSWAGYTAPDISRIALSGINTNNGGYSGTSEVPMGVTNMGGGVRTNVFGLPSEVY